jgi:hypothetical protein
MKKKSGKSVAVILTLSLFMLTGSICYSQDATVVDLTAIPSNPKPAEKKNDKEENSNITPGEKKKPGSSKTKTASKSDVITDEKKKKQQSK